ncbi:MAG TPA: glycoside hydrolase, partial [Polyangiaceae bacterium]|nr:glycoside hydrolase [Polyangiaceae bacterium]
MFSLASRTLHGPYLCGLLLVTSCGTEEKANPTPQAGDGTSSLGGNTEGNASQRVGSNGGTGAASSRSGATRGSAIASGGNSRSSQSTLSNKGASGGASGGATGEHQSSRATQMGGSTTSPSDAKSTGGATSASKAKGGAASTTKLNGGASQGGAANTRASSTGGTGKGGAIASEPSTTGRPRVTAASGATLVRVDAAAKYQKFEGWGASLCWWAYQLGGWSAAKRDQFLDLVVNPTTGLGYNIFRYNIGGGDAPTHSHMGTNREMPGFQSSTGTWDWNADARQTSVLNRLVKTAKDVIVEAFSNSPPYWMTKSGCASGNTDGSNNLKDDSYGAFADYLTEVVKHYRDELGITFRTLEPMNEPNANWWKANGGQEGCHFGASSQQQLIKSVGTALAAKGLTETQISASDENSMDDAYSIMSGYDAATLGYVSQMNVHSYAGSRRTQL